MIIYSRPELNKEELKDINSLVNICRNYDNISGCMFLENEMNEYEDFPCFTLIYEENILVGVMSIFIPDTKACEIYSYVHPDYRRQGYFNTMLKKNLSLLKNFGIKKLLVVCEPDTSGVLVLNHLGAASYNAEYLMKLTASYMPAHYKEYILKYIDNCYFELQYDSHTIGSCYVDYNDNCTTLYDVLIYKEHRGKGYSTILIDMVLNELKKRTTDNIVLHVSGNNIYAIKAYLKAGFEIIQEVRYYKLIF